MILWLNGTYGVGKSETANKITGLYVGNSKVLDPDQLWLEEIKRDVTIVFGDGTYPQNNKKFLQILKRRLDKEIKEYKGILIVPMTVTEDLSYNTLIVPYNNIIKHFILTANDECVKSRINKNKSRDQSLAIGNMKANNKYLKNIENATFIDTSDMNIEEVAKYILKGVNIMGLFSSSSDNLKVGDKVRVKYRDQEGYIIDKNGDLYMVSINDGQYVDSYSADQLEKTW